MSNPKDVLEHVTVTAGTENEAAKQANHAAQAHPNSHANFFANKKPKVSYVADEEDAEQAKQSARDQRQSVRRIEQLSTAVQDALLNRVSDAGGDQVMRVTWEEMLRMQDDPKFKSFAKYCHLILNYADGSPRPQPLRPFLEHEVGMYTNAKGEEKIVVLKNNPGDGALSGKLVSMYNPPPKTKQYEAEKDPFPSPKADSAIVSQAEAPHGLRVIDED